MGNTTEATFYEQAKSYAEACISNIREMLEKLEHARECDGEEIDGEPCEHLNDEEWHDEDGAQRAIDYDPLSIQVRGDWHNPGDRDEAQDTEYEILLTAGGPAARIVGDLQGGQPSRARFEYQDWFKPWTEVILDSADSHVLLDYAQRFYCNRPLQPADSLSFAGMESADQDRAVALGVSQAEELSALMRTPKADISAKAGRMEREAPLFFGTGDSPNLF